MKKLFSVLIISASLLCTGCGGSSDGADGTVSTYPTRSDGSPDIYPEIVLKGDIALKAGIWSVIDEDEPIGFYVMKENGEGGESVTYQTGTGEEFTYALYENEAEFHYGDDLGTRKYTVESYDGNKLVLKDNHDDITELTFVKEGTAADISFRTNEEVGALANEYYKAVSGSKVPGVSTVTNPDGTVTVRLFKSTSEGAVTYGKYTVDRETLVGKDDMHGLELCLLEPPVIGESQPSDSGQAADSSAAASDTASSAE